MRITLEVCVDDAAGLRAACEGGADRIELCAALALGGLTPSAGLIALAADQRIPVMAMIRPRAGDFVWQPEELQAQIHEIAAVRAAGLAGVVIGASLLDGRLDRAALTRLAEAAAGLDITLHRAIDLSPDPVADLSFCRSIGISRVLSSGGAETAREGLSRLQAMAAVPGMVVMPGGGVSTETIGAFIAALPQLTEVHASCARPLPPPHLPAVTAFGFQPAGARGTDRDTVRALRSRLDQICGSAPLG